MIHSYDKIAQDFHNHPSINHAWKTLNYKLRRNTAFHIIMNTILFMVVAVLITLNLWGMKTNFEKTPWVSNFFLAMAIITAFSGLCSSMISIFRFKSRSAEIKHAIKEIESEYEDYKAKAEPYDRPNRDAELLKTVSELSFIPK